MTDMSAYLASRSATAPLQNYLSSMQADAAQKSADQRAQAAHEAELRQRALLAYMGAHKGHEDEIINANPQMFGGIQRPTLTPTRAEQNQSLVENDFPTTFASLPPTVKQQGVTFQTYGLTPPSDTVKLLNAQDVTAHPQQWTPEVAQRQAIEDKRALDAKDAAVVPSEVAKNTATAANQQADAQYTAGPKTALTNSQKRGEDITNRYAGSKYEAEIGLIHANTAGKRLDNAASAKVGGHAGAAATDPIAIDLANGTYDPKLLRNLIQKDPAYAQAIEARAREIDPEFSMANYDKYAAVKKAYSTGPQGQNITSINTVLQHASNAYDGLVAMNNGSVPGYNAAANWLGEQFGNENVQQHAASVRKSAHTVASELNKVLTGAGQPSEKNTASLERDLGPNATPAQALGAIGEAIRLSGSRLQQINEAFKRDSGRTAPPTDFISPESRAVLEKFAKLGIDTSGFKPISKSAASAGTSASTPTSAPAPAPAAAPAQFKQTATNSAGHRIGSNDDGATWYDVATGKRVQ